LGTLTVGVTGLAARRVAGARAGIVAAFIAAVYPNFWFSDGLVMSETLVLLAMASTFVLAYRFRERPGVGRAVALGVAIGVTALTRTEALLLLVLLGVPLVLSLDGDGIGWQRRIGYLAVTGATTVVLISPWVVYNLSRFEDPVYLSVSDHTLLAGNCPDVYDGSAVGFWTVSCILDLNCPDPADRRTERGFIRCLIKVDPDGDASTTGPGYRDAAISNIQANKGRLPFVVFAREGRTWGFYKPSQGIELDRFSTREPELSRLALGMYYALAAGTVGGIVVLRKRRIPVLPLLAPVISVALTVSVTFGETRYRALAEVSLVVLTAVAIDAAVRSLERRRARGPDDGDRPTIAKGESPERGSNPQVLVDSGS
jgi:4-amino-4-deoxy-L-arabinose transferase-like glycosyltransferase